MEKALGKVLQLLVNNGRMTEAGQWGEVGSVWAGCCKHDS